MTTNITKLKTQNSKLKINEEVPGLSFVRYSLIVCAARFPGPPGFNVNRNEQRNRQDG